MMTDYAFRCTPFVQLTTFSGNRVNYIIFCEGIFYEEKVYARVCTVLVEFDDVGWLLY